MHDYLKRAYPKAWLVLLTKSSNIVLHNNALPETIICEHVCARNCGPIM